MQELHLIGRIVLGVFFLQNAYSHFTTTAGMTEYARSKGVPSPQAAVLGGGVLLLLGGLSILLGYRPAIGILLLVLFLLPVSFMMHAFWKVEGEAKVGEMVNFSKNLAITGALLAMTAIPTPWPYSL
ncbi:MAG: DoxX family membrane protein [Longimicrobiales bacterium]